MCKYKERGICNASDEMSNKISPAACVYIIDAYEIGYNRGKEEQNKEEGGNNIE